MIYNSKDSKAQGDTYADLPYPVALRRRRCTACGHRFSTVEIPKEAFDQIRFATQTKEIIHCIKLANNNLIDAVNLLKKKGRK